MKYTLISILILTIVMLFWTNKMIEVKKNLEKKVLGSYYSQMEEINESSGIDVYNSDNKTNYKQVMNKLNENSSHNITEELK